MGLLGGAWTEHSLFGQPTLSPPCGRGLQAGSGLGSQPLSEVPAPACLWHGEVQGFGGQLLKKGSLWAEVEVRSPKAHLLFPPPPCAVPQVHLACFLAQGKELLEAGGFSFAQFPNSSRALPTVLSPLVLLEAASHIS